MTESEAQQSIRRDLERIVNELDKLIPKARAKGLQDLTQRLEEARKATLSELASYPSSQKS